MTIEKTLPVRIKDGLHARPAALFVKLAKSFDADLTLKGEKGELTSKSTVKLMLLSIREGEKVTLQLNGADEDQALAALEAFLLDPESGLDALDHGKDTPSPAPSVQTVTTPSPTSGKHGIGAAQGIAIGQTFACFAAPIHPSPGQVATADIPAALARFNAVHSATLTRLRHEGRGDAITEALISVAEDEDFIAAITAQIETGSHPDNAVIHASQNLASRFEALDDPYQQARAEDIRSIARALILALRGEADPDLAQIPASHIIIAEELSALTLARAPFGRIGGMVCTKGSATSHVAIMARTHGIPTVLGYQGGVEALKKARIIALDGSTGEVVLDPDEATQTRFQTLLSGQQAERAALTPFITVEPRTKAGQPVEIAANLGSLREIAAAKAVGAMGVGLLRTEMLFMDYRLPPGEEEQVGLYTEVAQAFAPYPVIIRALDIGADKSVPGVVLAHEENPFLGCRGIRLLLQRPDLLRTQIRAVLRAGVTGNIKLLIPMITTAGEMQQVRTMMEACQNELAAEGLAFGSIGLGAMIETPAAALIADDLAKLCDFFSIGTNDLAQYVTASDRMNAQVADLCRADHPAVLKMIEMICASAHKAGIWVGICGEAAGDRTLIPFFVRHGVRELSMSASLVLQAKKLVTEL